MTAQRPLDLATLVDVYVELSLSERLALLQFQAPSPPERLAFEFFRRQWPCRSIACRFTEPQFDIN